MSLTIPDSHKDLFEQPVYAVVTTLQRDGQPQSTVNWMDYDGQNLIFTTVKGRQKEKNLAANPKVTVILIDPQDPYRWIEVRGVVEEATTEGASDHIEKMSWKYKNQKYYGGYNKRYATPDQEQRILYKIKPTKINPFPKKG
jgi:PPOX class probable F420-dependent enzyme